MGKCDLNLPVPQFPLIRGSEFSILHPLFGVLTSSKQREKAWFAFVCLFIYLNQSEKKEEGSSDMVKIGALVLFSPFQRRSQFVIEGNRGFTAEQSEFVIPKFKEIFAKCVSLVKNSFLYFFKEVEVSRAVLWVAVLTCLGTPVLLCFLGRTAYKRQSFVSKRKETLVSHQNQILTFPAC